MLEEIHAYARQGSDFSFETTLAGKIYTRLLKALKADTPRVIADEEDLKLNIVDDRLFKIIERSIRT